MDVLNNSFSHIYIESEAYDYDITKRIIDRLGNSEIITIEHYKDIFSRTHQEFREQKDSMMLILAVNHEKFVYEGAKVCQDFGNDNFYYCSNIKNCVFDCEYCYLQGMYSSGNIVIYVNMDDLFHEVDDILQINPVYLCISYDTDILALEGLTGIVSKWAQYANSKKNLTLEIRTKFADINTISKFYGINNFIFAWTISPDEIVSKYEHKTYSIQQRLKAAKITADNGGRIHLCFDPMIYVEDFEKVYGKMINEVFSVLRPDEIEGFSAGTFRISQAYMKDMRKSRVSAVTEYPYVCKNGVYQYKAELQKRMMDFVVNELGKYNVEEKVFLWK